VFLPTFALVEADPPLNRLDIYPSVALDLMTTWMQSENRSS
jgi:hypothetical protein